MKSNLGNTIRTLRKKSGLSRNELASLAGVGKTSVFDVEQNKMTVRLDTVLKILNVLNIDMVLKSPLTGNVEIKWGK